MEFNKEVLDSIFESDTIQPPTSSQNSFYIYKADGDLVKSWHNLICFAAVGYGYRGTDADIFAATHRLYSSSQGAALTNAENFEFTDWLINRSQFADAFLQKDADWCVKRQGVVIRGDVPSNYVIFLATIHRSTQEYLRIPRAWLYLRNHVSEDVALYLAHYFVVNDRGDISYGPLRSGHAALNDDYSCRNHLENFLSANIVGGNKNFNENTSYRGVDKLWWPTYTSQWKRPLVAGTKNFLANPFVRPDKEIAKENTVHNWAVMNGIEDLIKWEN